MRALPVIALAALVLALGGYFWFSTSDSGGPPTELPSNTQASGPVEALTPEGDAELAELKIEEVAGDAERAAATSLDELAAPTLDRADARVVGSVRDPDGRPVSGASVQLAPRYPWQMNGIAPVSSTTDDAGSFDLEVEQSGEWTLRLGADGFAPFARTLSVADNGNTDAGQFVLVEGVQLSGIVRDRAGRPVADAVFHARAIQDGDFMVLNHMQREVARTDASGRFEIRRQAAGEYSFAVRHENHPEARLTGSVERPGQRASDLEVTLEDGATIRGHVVGAPPGEELSVSASQDRGNFVIGDFGHSPRRSAEVAEDGSFELRGLVPEATYRLTARRALGHTNHFGPIFGSQAVRSEPVPAKAGDTGVRVEYSPGSTLTLRVIDGKTGQVLTDFNVESGINWPSPLLDEEGDSRRYFPDGLVEIPGLRPTASDDTVQLEIRAVGYKDFEAKDIRLALGEDLDYGVVRMEPVPVVRVTVLDGEGEPVEGAHVTLARHEAEESGSFSVRREVSIGGGGSSDHVTIGDEQSQTAVTDARGLATLSSFPGKEATISVRAEGYARAKTDPLHLPVADDYEHEVGLALGGSVLVTVVDPDGSLVSGRKVQHEAPTAAGEPRMMILGSGGPGKATNADGEVLFESLEVGAHRFRLGKRDTGGGAFAMDVVMARSGGSDDSADWSTVEVADGQVSEITLVAPAQSFLEGRILEAGSPLTGASLSLKEASAGGGLPGGIMIPGMGGAATARTDGKGDFLFEDLDAGDYTLTVKHPGRVMPTEFEVTVREGGSDFDADLDVTLLEGRVVGPDGKALAGVRVEAKRSGGEGGTRTRMVMIMEDGEGPAVISGGDAPKATTTDEDGYYQLRGVASDVDLVVEARGSDFQPTRSETVRVPAGALQDGVDITMKEAGRLTVTVMAADGNPASNALVNARFDGDSDAPIDPKFQMARDGSTDFKGLTPGRWLVSASPMGQAPTGSDPTPVEVLANETAEVTLTLP